MTRLDQHSGAPEMTEEQNRRLLEANREREWLEIRTVLADDLQNAKHPKGRTPLYVDMSVETWTEISKPMFAYDRSGMGWPVCPVDDLPEGVRWQVVTKPRPIRLAWVPPASLGAPLCQGHIGVSWGLLSWQLLHSMQPNKLHTGCPPYQCSMCRDEPRYLRPPCPRCNDKRVIRETRFSLRYELIPAHVFERGPHFEAAARKALEAMSLPDCQQCQWYGKHQQGTWQDPREAGSWEEAQQIMLRNERERLRYSTESVYVDFGTSPPSIIPASEMRRRLQEESREESLERLNRASTLGAGCVSHRFRQIQRPPYPELDPDRARFRELAREFLASPTDHPDLHPKGPTKKK